MQPMSSMQTTLLPGVTPGWNDPPPLGNPSSGSRLNRYRRVVDPSLSAAGGSPTPYAASPQQGMPMGMPQGMSPQPMLQQQPMQPMQPVQQQYYAQPDYSMPRGQVAPIGHGDPSQEQQQQHLQQPLPQQQLQPNQSAAPPIYPPTQSVTSPGPYPMSPYQQPLQMVNITHHTQYDSGAYALQAQQMQMQQQQQAAQMAAHFSTQPSTHSSPQQNGHSGSTEANLVFNPPNAVPGEDDSFVDQATWRPPMKAPGDVSLPGSALPGFLVKAAVKLHQAKSQGVQLGLKPLQGEIGEMSKDDPFIKKFNYVVDAVDREDCEDASRHLQEMLNAFPLQTLVPEGGTERKWVGAIKLLLKELPLRNATGRSH